MQPATGTDMRKPARIRHMVPFTCCSQRNECFNLLPGRACLQGLKKFYKVPLARHGGAQVQQRLADPRVLTVQQERVVEAALALEGGSCTLLLLLLCHSGLAASWLCAAVMQSRMSWMATRQQ